MGGLRRREQSRRVFDPELDHGMLTDTLLRKHFEFRGAIDHTIEVYCNLCQRVIFEIHEDSLQNGSAIAEQHFKESHEGVTE